MRPQAGPAWGLARNNDRLQRFADAYANKMGVSIPEF